jgi:hypothetical protein
MTSSSEVKGFEVVALAVNFTICACLTPESNSDRLFAMTGELKRSLRVIYNVERSIHALELAREGAQQVAIKAIAYCQKYGRPIETNQRVMRARAYIALLDSAIHQAKARIDELERGRE